MDEVEARVLAATRPVLPARLPAEPLATGANPQV
jgi:hypothetical protein